MNCEQNKCNEKYEGHFANEIASTVLRQKINQILMRIFINWFLLLSIHENTILCIFRFLFYLNDYVNSIPNGLH